MILTTLSSTEKMQDTTLRSVCIHRCMGNRMAEMPENRMGRNPQTISLDRVEWKCGTHIFVLRKGIHKDAGKSS